MQQERGSDTQGGDHHNIHQRLVQDQMKGKLQENQKQQVAVPPPQHQPQKCPRCDSLNTKFCYYNNYSLSQPRYFCKTCRRYWTQGGTLRNVPVGGGCRKGKRSKKPSSTTTTTSTITTTHDHHHHHQNLLNITTTTNPSLTAAAAASQNLSSSSPLMAAGASPLYYPSGGFLSSLAAFQAPFNQAMNIGDHFSTGSNLALLQGFSLPSITHHQQQVFNMGMGRDDHPLGDGSIIHESNRPSSSSTTSHHHRHQEDWHLSFNSNNSNSITTGYWSSNSSTSTTPVTSTTPTTTINSATSGHHWSDLPGFGPLPSTSSSSPSFL